MSVDTRAEQTSLRSLFDSANIIYMNEELVEGVLPEPDMLIEKVDGQWVFTLTR